MKSKLGQTILGDSKIVLTEDKLANEICHALSVLIESKAALPEIAGILETKGAAELLKSKPDLSADIMSSAFEWLYTDRAYAHRLIDLLSDHGVGLSWIAIITEAERALELVKNFPDQPLLNDPIGGIGLLVMSIQYCENPIEMLSILMDTPREKQILAMFEYQRAHGHTWSDLVMQILTRMNVSLSLDQCLELIDFVMKKGQRLLPIHLSTLKSQSEGRPGQEQAIFAVLTRHLRPQDFSPEQTLFILEYLLEAKHPLPEIKKILDFVDSQPWKVNSNNNLVDKIYDLELYRNIDWDNIDQYVLSLFELLLDQDFSPDHIFISRKKNCPPYFRGDRLIPDLIFRQLDIDNTKKLLTALHAQAILKQNHNLKNKWDMVVEQLIDQFNPVNARHREAILFQLTLQIKDGYGFELLRGRYRQTDDQESKDILSGMIACSMDYRQPIGLECGRLEDRYIGDTFINSAVGLREETRYYFTTLPTVIHPILETFLSKVLIEIVKNYLTQPSLVGALASFVPPPEHKDLRYKLRVRHQNFGSSDCGAHALTNALLGAALIKDDLQLWTVLRGFQPDSEYKGPYGTLLEDTRDQIRKKASQFRQGDNKTSPVVMCELIEQDDSKLIRVIRDFNQADPTVVFVDIVSQHAHIGAFDALAQLQMLNNMIHIFNRLQKGEPVGGYPFLIFLEHHWITALCFGSLFLICDSFDQPHNYLSEVCRPIQEAITSAFTLKALCKTVLAQAYMEFPFFQNDEIKSPGNVSRQITGLFKVWRGITDNIHLRSALENVDVLKFKRTQDLSRALKKSGAAQDLTGEHSTLVRQILDNSSLFSREIKYVPVQFRISEPGRDNHLAVS